MLLSSISSNGLMLGLFAIGTAAILAATQAATADRIAEAERAAAQKALLQIVPQNRHNNDLLSDTVTIKQEYWPQLGLKDDTQMYIARNNGEAIAAIIPATAADGYSGDIKLIVGINVDGSIAGVRVLAHKETPGLGDKVDIKKSDWVSLFKGKSLNNPTLAGWSVKKDGGEFDQFTGATITPRAVVKQIKRTLQFFAQSQPLATPTPATEDGLQSLDKQKPVDKQLTQVSKAKP